MPVEQSSQHCAACGRPTLHQRNAPSHILHAIITLFTFGLWVVVWILACFRGPWRCQVCGSALGSKGPAKSPWGILLLLLVLFAAFGLALAKLGGG